MSQLWVVEIYVGGHSWTPIACTVSEPRAQKLACAPHIVEFGKPVRVREYGKAAKLAHS